MPTVRYTIAQGEVIAEKRAGTRRLYTPDPLGSTVALIDNTQTITDTWVYWPYGEVKTRTGTTATPFQYVGTQGYYHDSDGRAYVRARFLDKTKARWLTEDLIWSTCNRYVYVSDRPTSMVDPSGLFENDKPPKSNADCEKVAASCKKQGREFVTRRCDDGSQDCACCTHSDPEPIVLCGGRGGKSYSIPCPKPSTTPPTAPPKKEVTKVTAEPVLGEKGWGLGISVSKGTATGTVKLGPGPARSIGGKLVF